MKTAIKQILQVIRFISACIALIMGLFLAIDCYLGAAAYEWLMSLFGANISINSFLIAGSILLLLGVVITLILEVLDKKASVQP